MPCRRDDGAFWYHHIQDHPDFAEMARQNVRYLWSSFWFTHLGEYLPDEKEWFPYTYAKWWKLGQTMSDEKINAFVRDMRALTESWRQSVQSTAQWEPPSTICVLPRLD